MNLSDGAAPSSALLFEPGQRASQLGLPGPQVAPITTLQHKHRFCAALALQRLLPVLLICWLPMQLLRSTPFSAAAAGGRTRSVLPAFSATSRASRRQTCSAAATAMQVTLLWHPGCVATLAAQPLAAPCLQAVTIIGGGRVGQALADMGPGTDVSGGTLATVSRSGVLRWRCTLQCV